MILYLIFISIILNLSYCYLFLNNLIHFIYSTNVFLIILHYSICSLNLPSIILIDLFIYLFILIVASFIYLDLPMTFIIDLIAFLKHY
jgi:hypothetical protein